MDRLTFNDILTDWLVYKCYKGCIIESAGYYGSYRDEVYGIDDCYQFELVVRRPDKRMKCGYRLVRELIDSDDNLNEVITEKV